MTVEGFYVTIMRGAVAKTRVGFLLGPFASEPAARERIPDARRVAEEIDPRCAFDFFGTSRVEGVPLPVGVLNDRRDGNGCRPGFACQTRRRRARGAAGRAFMGRGPVQFPRARLFQPSAAMGAAGAHGGMQGRGGRSRLAAARGLAHDPA